MTFYGSINSMGSNAVSFINLKIIGMETRYDYAVIYKKLINLDGIQTIKPYSYKNIISIGYFPNLVSKEAIIYNIISLGYRLFDYKSEKKPIIKSKGG